MRKVLQRGTDVKAKRARVRELTTRACEALEVDTKLELIQALIPVGVLHVQEVLAEEVRRLAGERYQRNGRPGHVRWTRQWGSVSLADQKLPVRYQRVRERRKGREVELRAYRRLQEPRGVDEGLRNMSIKMRQISEFN